MDADEIALRKQAIERLLNGESKSSIARQLGKPRLWVVRWAARYDPDDPEGSLQDRDSAPKAPHCSWSEQVRQIVLHSRQAREAGQQPGYKYSRIGAQAIYYELAELGISPVPPVRTIHAWLKQAGMIEKRRAESEKSDPKPYPAPQCQNTNDVHELDLKGPFYLTGSSQKYYLVALRDVRSKRVALMATKNMQMETIIDFVLTAWLNMGLPKILQMDNGLEFRGSNRYPRSPGRLVRVCMDLGVEALFIPPHEPWRNGVIENLNGFLDRWLLQREHFASLEQLRTCTAELETAINMTHRLPALQGKTPMEFAQTSLIHCIPQGYDWRKRNLQLVKGKMSFIRLVRKSGRITLCARDKFEIGSEYQWQYVFASVDFATQRLDVLLQDQLIKSFDYR